ncbi:MAG: hypothetical protein QM754_10480 [Tepidisphaeraceae bacterium]
MPPALPGFARRDSGRVVFRDGPTSLPVSIGNLRSADGHDVALHLRVSVRAVDRAADVQLFAEQFLTGRDSVAAEELAGHFRGALTSAAAEWVAAHAAADAVDRPADLAEHLRKQADAAAFGCGIELVHPWQLSADSVSLRAERDREQAQRRALAEAQHSARLAESLAGAPVDRLPSSDLAALLPSLLAARPAVDVLISAGPNLVVIDAANDLRVIAAPPAIGPLRSVRQLNDGTIALGGTSGVAVLSSGFETTRVLAGGGDSGRGYNAVAGLPGRLFATHGELGLTAWDDAGNARVFATPAAARGVVTVGDSVWLAAGNAVCRFDGDAVLPVLDGQSRLLSLLVIGRRVIAVREDGTVQTIDPDRGQVVAEFRHRSAIVAAAPLEVDPVQAIVFAGDRGEIEAVTPDGKSLGLIAPRTPGVRMLALVGSRITTITADRTSVLLHRPAAFESAETLNILARTGYHITDVNSSQWKL